MEITKEPLLLQCLQVVVKGDAVWQPKHLPIDQSKLLDVVHKDVLYSNHIVLTGLVTNLIVPYPSSKPYEEYTLSNDVVFTMNLSKALRKTPYEIGHACDPKWIMRPRRKGEEEQKKVLCYGNIGVCHNHLSHQEFTPWGPSQSCGGDIKWRVWLISLCGDVSALQTLFPLLLMSDGETDLLPIATLRGESLIGASCGGEKTLIQRLLAVGTNVDSVNSFGNTLMLASFHGQLDCVNILLAAKADVNAVCRSTGESSLMMASRAGHTDIVKRLLAAGAQQRLDFPIFEKDEGMDAEEI